MVMPAVAGPDSPASGESALQERCAANRTVPGTAAHLRGAVRPGSRQHGGEMDGPRRRVSIGDGAPIPGR